MNLSPSRVRGSRIENACDEILMLVGQSFVSSYHLHFEPSPAHAFLGSRSRDRSLGTFQKLDRFERFKPTAPRVA